MKARKIIYKGAVGVLMSVASIATLGCHAFNSKTVAAKQIKTGYNWSKDIVYTPKSWSQEVKGDLYRPKISNKAPVVLLVHGGGWSENDNRYQMRGIAKKLARRGYAVFNVTYRLAPQYHFPAPVDDLLEALKWLKQNDSTYNLDMQRVAIYGYSAGGHLGELAAMRKMPAGVKIQAVVAGGTPHFMRVDPDFHMVRDFIGVDFSKNAAPYFKATPVDQVTADFPPVFIYHGDQDDLVPTLHVKHWVNRLKELGVEHQVHWVKGRGHIGTFLLPQNSIREAIDFLDTKLKPRTNTQTR